MADDNKDLGEFAAFVPGAKPDLGEFAQFVPQEKPRSALGEIGNQLKAGVVSDLPKMVGQAIQYASDPGRPVYEFGKSIADYGRQQAARPDLQPQEAQHNVVTNALAAGARMIPQSIVPAVGVGLAASGVGAPAGAALVAGSVLGAAPAGMAQAQDTLDKAHEKGLPEDEALAAARKTGAIEWGGETIGNYLGGKLFGIAGRALGKSTGTAAEQALEQATNTQVLKPWLRQLPETVIGEVGTEMGQNAGEAYVEQQAGIDNHSPWDAAKEAIGPTLGMTALLAPFGLAGMGVNAHRQQQRNQILTSPDADQDSRTRIAQEIAPEIEKVDRQAAANFRANAARAIAANQPITLDSTLFNEPGTQAPPPTAATASATPPAAPGQPGLSDADMPDAGAEIPAGPLTRAAAAGPSGAMLPLRTQEMAQKQADRRTQETGLAHEVVPHPTAIGMFGVRPLANPALDPDAAPAPEAPLTNAATPGQDEVATTPAPVGLQPGDAVQVTINGEDQFEGGTRVLALSPDGQSAQVEGIDTPVPVTSLTRIDPAAAAKIEEGAHLAATSPQNDRLEPTTGQQEAGNYKKGRVTLQGLDLSIENPAGSTRRGKDRDGTPWETTMAHHYGYILGTNGADNEHIDAYVGPNPASHHVFVIDQVDPQTGAWDEHKVMLGFNSQEQARAAYDQHYAPDWKGGTRMTATTMDGFKEWMKGDTTLPFNPAAFEQPDAAQQGPLSDDQLNDLFDRAEAELAQEQQQPAAEPQAPQAPAVQEPDLAARWNAATPEERVAMLTQAGREDVAEDFAHVGWDDLSPRAQEALSAPQQQDGPSQQFASYRDHIAQLQADGKPVPQGLLEQIQVDERLNDGEADQLAKLAQGEAQAPAGRQGYDSPVEVDARALQAVLEANRGGPLAEKPEKLAALRNGAKSTGNIELAFRDRDGKLDINDGRHRIALAAERGEKVNAFIDGKDVERLQRAVAPALGNDEARARYAELSKQHDEARAAHDHDKAQAILREKSALQKARLDKAMANVNSPAGHLQALVDEANGTGDSVISQVYAPGFQRGDKDAAALYDAAYRKALTDAGWTQLPKTPEQIRKEEDAESWEPRRGEAWTKDGMRLHLNYPVADRPASILLQPGEQAQQEQQPQAEPEPRPAFDVNSGVGANATSKVVDGKRRSNDPDAPQDPVEAMQYHWAWMYATSRSYNAVLDYWNRADDAGRARLEPLLRKQGELSAGHNQLYDSAHQRAKIAHRDHEYHAAQKQLSDQIHANAARYVEGVRAEAERLFKQAPQAEAKPAGVDYPNRRLGFQKARTDEADAYNDHAWANIAAANMKIGDTFQLNGKQQTVESIGDKTLKLKDADGKVRTLNPDGVAWEQFKRDLAGQLMSENLQANNILKPARPLLDILKRDPAVHVDSNGSVYLRDGGPVPAAQQQQGEAKPDPKAEQQDQPPADPVVTEGPNGKPVVDRARIVFKGSGYSHIDLPADLVARVQEALRTQPDAYHLSVTYKQNDTRIKLGTREKLGHDDMGELQLRDDGSVTMMGDDAHHWGSTMSQASAIKTLQRWLAGIEARAKGEQAPEQTEEQEKPGRWRAFTQAEAKAIAGMPHGAGREINDALHLGFTSINPMSIRSLRARLMNMDPDVVRPQLGTMVEIHEREWAEKHPVVENQKKVHTYNEKEAKPLLILACADEKLEGKHRAIDLYKGALFDVLRKWLPRDAMDVYILSAKHGLVHADTMLDSYDQKMTAERQKELIAKGLDLSAIKGNFSEVFVAGSQQYTEVGRVYAEQLRAAGFVGPDARVQTTVGFIGQQRGQLGAYLRKVQDEKGKLPANPAPLGVGVRVRVKFLDKPPIGSKHSDYNRFAGRVGTVEREMIVGDNRYFIVKLDDTPAKVERDQEFFSGHLDVITPAEQAGQAAPGALSENPEQRKAQIRERIEAILGANQQLVAQADLVKTGNRFQDFRDEYKAAFEKAVGQLFKDKAIEARDVEVFSASLKDLPGYVDRAARNFIADHHGEQNQERSHLAYKWGFTPENAPKDGKFPEYETALQYDNKRSGKEQLSFEIRVAQAPNKRWAFSYGYQQGGTGGFGNGTGITAPALTSVEYDTRMQAIEAAGAAIRQDLRQHGVDALRPHGQIMTAITRVALLDQLREKMAALSQRALAIGARKLAGEIAQVGAGMTANDVSVTPKQIKDLIDGNEKLVVRAERKAARDKAKKEAQQAQPPQPPQAEEEQEQDDQDDQDPPDAPDAPQDDGALAGSQPMSPKQFETALRDNGKLRFGDALFEIKSGGRGGFGRIQADTYVVDVTYPYSNKVIGFQQNLSLQQAIEAARSDAFDWWNNRRVKEAEFAKKREKLVRAGLRELYGVFSKDADLMKSAAEAALPVQFIVHADPIVRKWVEKEKAAGELDPDRKLMLDNLAIGGKTTLPTEWWESLFKYLRRAAKRAEKELDRDPAVYEAALVKAAQEAGAAEYLSMFKVGFDHALAGKTKSTLPPVANFQKGYDAGSAWMQTEEGQNWYTGRRGRKLENTGAALRRWFDESTRKIKEVTADNLPASYAIIKDQASRVEAFANVAGEGATPGTRRYINAIRDNVKPFQEWLLDRGPLGQLYGETGYRESDSNKVARFLDGRAYPYITDAAGKRVSMEDATPQERLELLQDAAATYNERLRGVAEAMAGATSVTQAAQRFEDFTVADKNARNWSSSRLTEAGKAFDSMLRGHSYQFEPGHYTVDTEIKRENEPDAPANRKQALLVPKLDRIVREGENLADFRAGKDVTPQQMKDTFGFADVGFGRYVGAKQDQDHLNYAFDAFMDLANLLGIDPKHIGLGGTLHFTIGALGHGRHAAHFQAKQAHPDGGTVPVINVTNTKGDGTVAHEWFHALDHALSAGWAGTTWKQGEAVERLVKLLSSKRDPEAVARILPQFVSGSRFMRTGRRNTPMYNTKTEDGLIKNAEHGLQYTANKLAGAATDYKREADTMGEDYWGNPRELLARAAEAWVHDTLGGTSNYLVNPGWVGEGKIKAPMYKGAPYPMGEERKLFNEALGALVKSLRFSDKGVAVDMDAFNEAFPDQDRQYREAIAAMKAQIPSMVRAHLAQKEAEKLAAQHLKNEAERAVQEKARAEQEERERIAREAEQARLREQLEKEQNKAAPPPSGPLSDADYEALFDRAENELAEEQQEQPEAKDPGEPAKTDHWTQEDYQHLLKLIEDGKVFLLADPSRGLSTIHDMPSGATSHKGYGLFQTRTDDYDVHWDGGGEMKQTPSGKSYTLVSITSGRDAFLKSINWDQAKTKLQAKLIVRNGPKAAPTLSAEQEKSAAQLIAQAAKLGVTGIEEAMKGIVQVFGGNALKSFPSGFDEESYKAAKPHFEKALQAFQAAGKTLVDLFKLLIQHFGPGVRPYAIRFAKDQGLSANLAPSMSATEKIARWVEQRLQARETFGSAPLFKVADEAFGGTQAEGKYSVKDAYDAMEAGMNRHILAQKVTPDGSATDAVHKVEQLEQWTQRLATQTRRTTEMDEFQQFSTPPAEAFVAAWVANIHANEQFVEPSAGTGNLAIYAQLAGAQVTVNELSSRRAEILKTVLPEATLFQENAEQLDNILPEEIKPSVIVMNPPFSSTAGRMEGRRDTMNGAMHIEQALKRLAPDGRLVAIVGSGMAEGKPAFKAWWDKIRQSYNVRVNITVDGSTYAKYGTTFDNQILVIDKTGPTTGKTLTGAVKTLAELPALLEGIRNERKAPQDTDGAYAPGQPDADQQGGDQVPGRPGTAGNRAGGTDADPLGAGPGNRNGAGERGSPATGEAAGAGQRDGQPLGAEGRGEVPDQPGQPGPAGRGANGRATGGAAKRPGRGGAPDRGPDGRTDGDGPVTGEVTVEAADLAAEKGELSDAIFESYTPQRLAIPGAKPHPGKLVQSAAMAAVLPPAPSYAPNLPKTVIEKGLLSLAQLEAVVYAGQAHSQMLPGNKERRGFFIGDGTGVGKGREIAGILLDNQRQGRKKAVWLSAKQGLLRDAKRDFSGVSGNPDLILAHNKVKAGDVIDAKEGILFTTYDTLRMGLDVKKDAPVVAGPGSMTADQLKEAYPKGTPVEWRGRGATIASWDAAKQKASIDLPNSVQVSVRFGELQKVDGKADWSSAKHARPAALTSKSRLDQIVNWLGKDFDGVIAFDEAHNMGNVLPRKGKRGTSQPAAKALAGVELQKRLPNARIVYVSATGATEVHNLGYATRLGLWGEGSAFAKVTDFIGGIESGGVAAMELVSRDMKAQGSYLARSLSFDGVTYDRLEHELTPLQNDIYNELARAWQTVLQNIEKALEATLQNKNPKAKSAALAQFWGSHQRFFNHIITSMQMPSIIEAAQRDLDAGHAVVMQLVNTNEAEQNRQAAKLAADEDAVAEDFDFTPRETLLNYVRNSFPVQQHEEYLDDNGNKATRPVVDAKGNPVFNREMVALRDQIVKNLEQIRVPDNPLDMVLRAFGTANVAEITGRKRRFVQVPDKKGGGFKVVEEKRPASSVPADADAFMADKKRVLVFSDAGGTGYSFQSDLNVANRRRRMHYLVQPGWRANNAVQGFGRTHRSNEENQPHYVLPTTNLKAQKRFISSIARRLDQLGALTKGQRETGGQGMFSATDNLESQYAIDALHSFFVDMYNGQAKLDFHETTQALGLNGLIDVQTGALNVGKLPDVPQFLNRLLSLETHRQDEVFEQFFQRLEEVIERAKALGTFDAGMETLRADRVVKLRDEVVYEDARTGASTRYVELELTHPTHFNGFDEVQRMAAAYGDKFLGYFRNERTNKVFALVRTGTSTDPKTGEVISRGMRLHTTGGARYGDEVDKILKGVNGQKTIKKEVTPMLYTPPAGEPLVETYTTPAGKEVTVTAGRLADLLQARGLASVEQTIEAGPHGPERDAFQRLLGKMRPHLTEQKPAERQVPAFQRLTPAQAKAEWTAEMAATPPTYTSKTHLLTGMLLPIWDRLPGDPRVVRTQTEDGERLLGRVVSNHNLEQTLKNLGVGSNLSKLPAAEVIERILKGERAVLANAWMLERVRVSNDNRIEVSGGTLAYNQAERSMLTSQGAFIERINWQERVFLPTGEKGEQALAKILAYKPLVDLGTPGASKTEDEVDFSRGTPDAGMLRGDVQRVVTGIARTWANAPAVTVVQRVDELPFKAPADTRGATFQGRVYLVADNLAHEGEVGFVLAHEALGHLGLSAILGEKALTQELNRLRLINPALAKAARAQATTYGYDLNLATEEALADMAGSGRTIKGWQKFAELVQKALRMVGLGRVADWMEGRTEAETMALLARAREAIAGSRTPRLFGAELAARFSDGARSPWYSQLARQIERLPMKSAPAAQWAETIMASGFAQKGVKQDEIYWSGVLEYLNTRKGERVTKADLLDYLAENGVRVTETMQGEPPAPTEEGLAARGLVFKKYEERLAALVNRMMDYDATRDERDAAEAAYNDLLAERNINADLAYKLPSDTIQRAKYPSYTLPGGQNYRELLLTLPEKKATSAELDKLREQMDALGELDTDEKYQAWSRLADAALAEQDRLDLQEKSNRFVSPHWDAPNVLAHIRFNDRVDGDGQRVLHVEELQSDWGQRGKADGFESLSRLHDDVRSAAAENHADLDAVEAAFRHIAADPLDRAGRPTTWAWDILRQAVGDAVDLNRIHDIRDGSHGKVPDAPFVGKTDSWLTLALKRVLSYAAENGYDRVSFVTGQQAVDRFQLSQQVKAVEVESAVGEPGYNVSIDLLDGTTHKTWATNDKDLINLMGKELGRKAIDKLKTDPLGTARFEGENLVLGGEGMRTFYDTIVPNTVNNLLRQMGGTRLDQADIIHDEPYDPAPGVTNYVDENGQLAYANHGVTENGYGSNNYYGHKGWSTQPAFEITEAMREKVKGGVPLFARNPVEDTGPLPAPTDETSLRLSRATPRDIARAVGGTLRSTVVTDTRNRLAHYRSVGLQFLGRLQLTDLYGYLFPQGTQPNMLQSYSDLAARMDAEKTEGGTRADELVRRWAKLKHEKDLAKLMHDATRLEIDPSKPYDYADNRREYEALRKRYDDLNAREPEAIRIFHEAARAYEEHYAAVQQGVRDRIARTLTAHPNRASLIARMEGEFFSRKVKGVYFPLARFGDYVVQVRFVGRNPRPGQAVVREAVAFAETLVEAEAERERLLREYPPEQGYQVMPVTKRAEFNAARDSVSRGFLKKLYAALDEAGMQDPSLQDTINQLYLTSLPDLSWAKSGIHRTGMPGFSQDARRAYAHHMFHGASYLAKLNYSDQLADVLESMQKYATEHAVDESYEQVKAQQVIDEMTKRHDAYLNPKGNALTTKLTSLGFVWFLGASPASAMVNLLQTPTVAFPLLGGKFGFTQAAKALLDASKQAMKGHNDMNTILTGDEKRAYEEWVRTGLVDLTMVHDLAGVASGRDNQLRGHMRTFMQAMSFMFHHAERFNRQATALAAYRLARQAGQNHDEAYRTSVEMTKASHFDYSAGNRPRFMQGPVAQVIFLFKQYAQNLIYTFARNGLKAARGDRQALRTFSGLLVTHALAAGVIGLPLVTTLLGAASMFGGSDDDPWDAEVALRRLLADLFGEKAGEVIAHGVSRLTPWDISGRVGADHLIFPDVQEGLQGERSFDAMLAGLLGPVVGIGANWARALQQWGRGDALRAVETALPSAARGVWRSGRYAMEDGARDRNGIVVVDDITLAEHAGSILGFSAGRVREKQEAKAAVYERDQALQRRRTQLLDDYARRKIKQEDVTDQMDAIRAFNQQNPTRVIAGLHLMQAVRARMVRKSQARQGLYLPARRGMDARQYGDFADEE